MSNETVSGVKNVLYELRTKRGIPAAQLAQEVDVSRQTIYAIEAGNYVPNTTVSLKLARALDTTVEQIFNLELEAEPVDRSIEVSILGKAENMRPGQPLRLCEVDGHAVAIAVEIAGWGLPPADAVLIEPVHSSSRSGKALVQLLGDKWRSPSRILLAGCDPGVSILAQSMQSQGYELIVIYENSSRSLELLRNGMVHVAGSHLIDKATGKADLLPITKLFPRNSVAAFCYAVWEEGLVTATGNPKNIQSVADLMRKGVRFTNREEGAGCRRLLDSSLRKAGITPAQIKGYDRVAIGHLAAARLVAEGEVDCCVSTRVVARSLSLEFLPLAEKPYHLLVRRTHLNLPPVQAMLETLGRATFRREVEAYAGYNMRNAGDRIV
jgi:putative molybdopterin biosynthesis protein